MSFAILVLSGLLFAAISALGQASVGHSSFYRDIVPILQDHCQSCHRPGEVAPMPLVTYEQTRPWAPAIAKEIGRAHV